MWKLFYHFYKLKFHPIDSYFLRYPWDDITLSSNLFQIFLLVLLLATFIPSYEYWLSYVSSKSTFDINLIMIAWTQTGDFFQVIYFIWVK